MLYFLKLCQPLAVKQIHGISRWRHAVLLGLVLDSLRTT